MSKKTCEFKSTEQLLGILQQELGPLRYVKDNPKCLVVSDVSNEIRETIEAALEGCGYGLIGIDAEIESGSTDVVVCTNPDLSRLRSIIYNGTRVVLLTDDASQYVGKVSDLVHLQYRIPDEKPDTVFTDEERAVFSRISTTGNNDGQVAS